MEEMKQSPLNKHKYQEVFTIPTLPNYPPNETRGFGGISGEKNCVGGGGFASGNAPGLRRSFGISKVPPFSAKSCGVTSGELRLPMVIPGPG